MLFSLLDQKSKNKEQELQRPLNICIRIYKFLVKLLAAQASKKVVLGQPLTLNTVESKEGNSCNETLSQSVDEEQIGLCVLKEKAPRKIVSIKDEVDEIRISSRRIKMKTSKGSVSSFDDHHDIMSMKPLKSILRKDSSLSKDQ